MEDMSSRLKRLRIENNMTQEEVGKILGVQKAAIHKYETGNVENIKRTSILKLAKIYGVNPSYLLCFDDDKQKSNTTDYTPQITNDYTSFPVIGEIAAGYDRIVTEDWNGDIIDIPNSYLKGHNKDEFFVLRVKGDSMYPMYQDGDKVLILKQSVTDNSKVAAILYDNELATLKKIELIQGDRLTLIPINPLYKPEIIEGDRINTCKIIGVPKMLIRDIE